MNKKVKTAILLFAWLLVLAGCITYLLTSAGKFDSSAHVRSVKALNKADDKYFNLATGLFLIGTLVLFLSNYLPHRNLSDSIKKTLVAISVAGVITFIVSIPIATSGL